jgi:hypothetical protein
LGTERSSRQSPTHFSLFGTTFEDSRIVKSPASEDAKEHLARSTFVTAIASGVLFVGTALMSHKSMAAFELAAAFSYLVWASYWGILAVVNGLAEITIREMPNLKAWSKAIADKLFEHGAGFLLILLPIAVGIVFGVLGGGTFVFLRYLKIAKHPEMPLRS